MCAEFKTLAWEENGKNEWRVPEKLTPEEIAAMDREVDESVRPLYFPSKQRFFP